MIHGGGVEVLNGSVMQALLTGILGVDMLSMNTTNFDTSIVD